MGTQYEVICNGCGARFSVQEGPGMLFDVLHCDLCGQSKGVSRETVLEYRGASAGMPPGRDASKSREWLMTNPTVGMSQEEYLRTVETIAGECECGGHFRFGASPRCPECGSSDHRRDPSGGVTMYD